MSRDYKAAAPKPKPAESRPGSSSKSGNPLVIGLLIGLLIGIALSVGVALTVNKSESAFHEKAPPVPSIPVPPPQTESKAEAAKPSTSGEVSSEIVEAPEKKIEQKADVSKVDPKAEPSKKEDRFTFYDILTEAQPPVVKSDLKPMPESPSDTSTKPAAEKLILQVGAFKTEQEADNTKAKLSLIGLEATVQSISIPDKGLLHRVRVGPFATQDELNRARAELSKNGFSAELVKNSSSSN
ncbi:MAG: SPOR domain-containing protein [Methylophilaceae bacterium]